MASNMETPKNKYHKIRKMSVKELKKESNINGIPENATRTLFMDKSGVSTSGQLNISPVKPRYIACQREFSMQTI